MLDQISVLFVAGTGGALSGSTVSGPSQGENKACLYPGSALSLCSSKGKGEWQEAGDSGMVDGAWGVGQMQ